MTEAVLSFRPCRLSHKHGRCQAADQTPDEATRRSAHSENPIRPFRHPSRPGPRTVHPSEAGLWMQAPAGPPTFPGSFGRRSSPPPRRRPWTPPSWPESEPPPASRSASCRIPRTGAVLCSCLFRISGILCASFFSPFVYTCSPGNCSVFSSHQSRLIDPLIAVILFCRSGLFRVPASGNF